MLHALDHTPDGTAWTLTSDPRWLPGWIRYRLTPWRTPDGGIASSPSQLRAVRHQTLAQTRAAAATEHQRLLARRIDAAAPAAAAAIQQQDQRRTRLNFVKTGASASRPSAPPGAIHPPSPAPAAGNGAFESSRPAEGHADRVSSGSITLREPEELFQRAVDRHALPGQGPADLEDAAAVAADRAWLARVVATQSAGSSPSTPTADR
ncbi:hypothetical protein ABZ815_51115 [Nonomuraea sp. NPDC047529]|uniref:hypothetical protein n=1 Tax=Nonomuraea sp. NPDC047529 TaxID=3155623 RepID=UPI00340BBEC1